MVIYCDGGSLAQMEAFATNYRVQGFTTNPSLMRKAGITNYREYAKRVLEVVPGKPISFEVLADDIPTMAKQAEEISSWGYQVYVKIPVLTCDGSFPLRLIETLVRKNIKLNITAVMTRWQIANVVEILDRRQHILSIFAGRIADTLRDASEVVRFATSCERGLVKVLWASARQIYDHELAESAGCDIITLSPDLIGKLSLKGKDLTEYSAQTVQQFHEDGKGIEF